MAKHATEAANHALMIVNRVLGEGGVLEQVASGELDMSEQQDNQLARRIRAMSETVRLTRANLDGSNHEEYPQWPEPAVGPAEQPNPRPMLPINRKERYYTGTVLPAIVTANRFVDLDILLELCGLPDVAVGGHDGAQWIEFLTEFNLAESLLPSAEKEHFPNAPTAGDTPDMVIAGLDWLVVVEAKMFHRPSKAALAEQFRRQKPIVECIRAGLRIDPSRVRHGFLLIDTATAPEGADFVLTWQRVIDAYEGVGPAYWLEALRRAVDAYDMLKSQTVGNAEDILSGQEIVEQYASGELMFSFVGRNGGHAGKDFTQDVAVGNWRTVRYQVSSIPVGNKNWFPIEKFLAAVTPTP